LLRDQKLDNEWIDWRKALLSNAFRLWFGNQCF
jgi:hypothetical protein